MNVDSEVGSVSRVLGICACVCVCICVLGVEAAFPEDEVDFD